MIHPCNNCVRFKNGRCVLDDLEPCRPVLNDPHRRAKDTFLAIVTIIGLSFIAAAILFACKHKREDVTTTETAPVSAVALLRELHKGELTDFDKLTLAIALTESRFNSDAVGNNGDSGLLQIREVYVQEVNRLYGTHYTIDDAFDVDKTLEIFRLMQDYYNPSKDIMEGIRHHNKGDRYMQIVLANLDTIERYEEIRAKLINLHY